MSGAIGGRGLSGAIAMGSLDTLAPAPLSRSWSLDEGFCRSEVRVECAS